MLIYWLALIVVLYGALVIFGPFETIDIAAGVFHAAKGVWLECKFWYSQFATGYQSPRVKLQQSFGGFHSYEIIDAKYGDNLHRAILFVYGNFDPVTPGTLEYYVKKASWNFDHIDVRVELYAEDRDKRVSFRIFPKENKYDACVFEPVGKMVEKYGKLEFTGSKYEPDEHSLKIRLGDIDIESLLKPIRNHINE